MSNKPVDIKTWVEKTVEEYAEKKMELEQHRKHLAESSNPKDQEDAILLSSMISDMQLALTWMKRGRRPGSHRGVERTDVYHQTAMQAILKHVNLADEYTAISAICKLSSREQQCFLAYYLEGLTQKDISIMLNVTRSTVRVVLNRAEKKLKELLD